MLMSAKTFLKAKLTWAPSTTVLATMKAKIMYSNIRDVTTLQIWNWVCCSGLNRHIGRTRKTYSIHFLYQIKMLKKIKGLLILSVFFYCFIVRSLFIHSFPTSLIYLLIRQFLSAVSNKIRTFYVYQHIKQK